MKPLEFAKKQLKHEEMLLEHYLEMFELYADAHHLKVLKEQVEKVKKKRMMVKQIENPTLTPFMKEKQIYFLSKANDFENELVENHHKAEKATAIIDEIIESEISAPSKIRLINLFLKGKITTLEIDAFLTE